MTGNAFDPQPGDQVTMMLGNHKTPGTVIKRTAKTSLVQVDRAELTATTDRDGQTYKISRDTEGEVLKYTARKHGSWLRSGWNHDALRAGWRSYRDWLR